MKNEDSDKNPLKPKRSLIRMIATLKDSRLKRERALTQSQK
ncbi:MAG: hypothetical protein RSG77_21690 [Hafnia sp.]